VTPTRKIHARGAVAGVASVECQKSKSGHWAEYLVVALAYTRHALQISAPAARSRSTA
jgi:hypothetical protein